jgi:CBS domain-containing protein
MTTTLRETARERLDELKTLRDQIRVDLNLAGMELKSEWRELEKRMPDVSRLAGDIKSATVEAVEGFLAEARRFRSRIASPTPGDGKTIAGLMSRQPAFCSPGTTLSEAARLMWKQDVGCLPVVENERVVGMITDRDACMAAYIQGRRLDQIEVRAAMSRDLYSCDADATPADAEAMMTEHQVRRLPVVDGGGRLLGIVTLGDLARRAIAGTDASNAVTSRAVTATFAAIVAPRSHEESQGRS